MKINLGGGRQRIPGYINIDKHPEYADVLADLEEGLPFPDKSVDVINASHIFEHIHNFENLMNECRRVLKDDGFLMAATPAFPSDGAIAPPGHVRYFIQKTFHCFKKDLCTIDREPWILEMNVEILGAFLKRGDCQQIFVLMRPDR